MEIKVAIFEDNKLVRDALEAILNGTKGFVCCGAFADAIHLYEKIERSKPDVVMMDIEMPGLNGIEATKQLKERFPELKVLIQTVFDDSSKIFQALCAGASGYVLKNDSPSRQLEAVEEIFNGGASISSLIAKKVLEFFTHSNVILTQIEKLDYVLTERELEVLKMMTRGYNFHNISEECFISYETVRTHVKRIYKKLHVTSKAEAILKANQQQIV